MRNNLPDINRLSLTMAIIALLVVCLFRSTSNWGLGWVAVAQPLFLVVLASIMFAVTRNITDVRTAGWRMIPFGIICLLGPFTIGLIERQLALGNSWEVLVLFVFANWTVCVSILSRFRRYQNLTAIFAGACVFVVVPLTNGWAFKALAIAYGLVLLYWSMTSYWKRLEQKFADESKSELSVRAMVFLVSGLSLLLVGGVTLLFASTRQLDLPGLSWFSGGSRWSDEYARDGVGDGNKVRAATDTAHSFGPVDSEIFMESDQPTLFDIANDLYGPPKKPKSFNRAIALDQEFLRHEHHQMARNQKMTGEGQFSTVRETKRRKPLKLDDQLSNALFFVKGEVPVRFAIETYNTLEDGVWEHTNSDQEDSKEKKEREQPSLTDDSDRQETVVPRGLRIPAEAKAKMKKPDLQPVRKNFRSGKPWMALRKHSTGSIYSGSQYRAVKIINFRSLNIPSPPCLEQLYIDKVDQPGFFGIGDDDIARLDNNSTHIPDMTVIHLLSSSINLYQAKTDPSQLERRLSSNRNTLSNHLGTSQISERVVDTARQWTSDKLSKWEKVEAIVNRLRSEFEHQPDASLSGDERDVAEYLLSQGGGTDYMFATTAALMFRTQGIPSRVVNGFYVSPERYDRKTGHTAVLPADIHVWTEVSLDGKFWIPVEPTPGYELPRYDLTVTQRLTLALISFRDWLLKNPLIVISILLPLLVLVWNRRPVVNRLKTLFWWLQIRFAPQKAVLATARLIDARSQLAGCSRPKYVSPAKFSLALADMIGVHDDIHSVARYCRTLNRMLYHPGNTRTDDSVGRQVVDDCRAVVLQFGFKKIRKLKNESRGDVAESKETIQQRVFRNA